MTTPKDTRPFNLDLAQQGHPLITRSGQPAKFIAYVPENDEYYQIIVCVEKRPVNTNKDGCFMKGGSDSDLFLSPLGYCEGKPVFANDELIFKRDGLLYSVEVTHSNFTECKWPSKVPVVETRMKIDELFRVLQPQDRICIHSAQVLANKAIERAIADGDVVPVGHLIANGDVIPTSLFVEMACKVFNKNYNSNASFTENAHIILKDYLEGLK